MSSFSDDFQSDDSQQPGPAENPSTLERRGASASPGSDFSWNFFVFTGDAAAWMFGVAFVDVQTVLPIFFQRALESLHPAPFHASVLAGLAAAIRSAGWLAPQFFSARKVSASPRKKPALLLYCWIGRLPVLPAALFLLTPFAASHAWITVLVVLAAWTMLSLGEGFSGVPWMDIISRTIPPRRRGRLWGFQQVIGGIFAAAAGLVVNRLLGSGAPAFPRNFGVLLSLAFVLLMVSQLFLTLIREPVQNVVQPETPLGRYLAELPRILGDDRFRFLVIVQLLGSIGGMGIPLYALFALQRLHALPSIAGSYLSASMAGAVVGSMLWGLLSDLHNPRLVIRLNLLVAALTPWTAVLVSRLSAGGMSPGSAAAVFAAVFFLGGMATSGQWAGYTNYLLEIAPEENRPAYIGLMNTLNAPAVAIPLIGTGIAGILSPTFVFLLAGAGCTAAFILSGWLPAAG